jgi:TolB-like protein
LTGFFTELKRRNVFRVGAAYLVMGWLLIEVASVLLPTFGAPEWVMKVFALLIILGFPIALFFAWAFELTPEGVKRESEIDRSQSITSTTGRKLDRTIIVLLVIALVYFAWERQQAPVELESGGAVVAEGAVEGDRATSGSVSGGSQSEAAIDHPISIAVLPFVNMSADPDQEFFSDGMTEEILNTLVKIPDLLVAARTSSFAYKGQNTDVRMIGEELGVAHIVEGSVRKAGDDLRITAQLIRVTDGFHLWSESYDRKMDNVFQIQEEIAEAVAEALKIPLGLSAGTLITNRTTDMEAYELYLRGRHWIRLRDERLADGLAAMEQVVAREPDFAPAWAMISISRGLLIRVNRSTGHKARSLPNRQPAALWRWMRIWQKVITPWQTFFETAANGFLPRKHTNAPMRWTRNPSRSSRITGNFIFGWADWMMRSS